jgi:outer membrane protein assembly factor BamB
VRTYGHLLRTLAATSILTGAAAATVGDWPQWRGPERDSVWQPDGLPDKLPATLTPRWRRPIGGGYGGVAVSGGRVFVMDRQKGPPEIERILCLDAATGKQIWEHRYPVSYGKLDYGNGPRATPNVHARRVYAIGALGHLHCLDAASGRVLWSRDTVKEFHGQVPTWGHACSPLVDGDRVVVQPGGTPDACLVALDAATGNELWRSLPDRPGYSSPVILSGEGWRELVFWTAEHLAALEPATGKVLWKVPFGPINYDVAIADPVFDVGVVLVSNYWTGSKAVRLDDRGQKPVVAWEGKQLSLLMSTPLVRNGHAYALDRFRGLKCIELRTGKVKWEDQHVTPRGTNPQASLVWAGDKALIFNEKGELQLASLTPEGFRSLGKAIVLSGLTWAHPAYADGCVFARNDEEIVCVPLRPDSAREREK